MDVKYLSCDELRIGWKKISFTHYKPLNIGGPENGGWTVVGARCKLGGSDSLIYFWMKRCFSSSISAVLIRGFQGVHPKNLLALQYVRNFLPSCITCLDLSLSIHRSILRSCDRKFVFRFWCRSRGCHRNKEKGTVTSQKPNLCLWGTWKFSPKNLRTEKNSQTNYFWYPVISLHGHFATRWFR